MCVGVDVATGGVGVAVTAGHVLRKTDMSLVFSFAVNISTRPSWLKSPASTDTGLDPEATEKLTGDWKVPLPFPNRIETLSLA